ncbi:MAG: HEAT repeat domain-containing protein [Bryobacterales bacterium]|nr:HEAT repeat domain-containing protein [Bryobacterales bacterium]
MGRIWRRFFDIRREEYGRAFSMFAYLLFVLLAYYILKPVSRAMFVGRFSIDQVPYLYILIAVVGGLMATAYSKVAVQISLKAAVTWTTIVSVATLVLFWWALPYAKDKAPWMLYVFNIWVSLFGVVVVAQGWIVASNVFNAREAKRVYGLVGLGAILGAWVGSAVTAFSVEAVGVENLVLVSGLFVGASYGAFLLTATRKGVNLASARGQSSEEAGFSLAGMLRDVSLHRHLRLIVIIITVTFIVDVMVEYQLQAIAKLTYVDAAGIAEFLGGFYLYLNILTSVLQLFATTALVRWLGVGGTLLVMPGSIALASIPSILSPGILATAAVRMVEAASRYSFNRAGMELLYLPLPLELRNRTKAFVDIAVDRLGRGLGGILLVAFTWLGWTTPTGVPVLTILFCAGWIVLALMARKEYVQSVRGRLDRRRFDLASTRVTVDDPAVIRALEQATRSGQPRQVTYALSVLAESPGYDLAPVLRRLAEQDSPEVQAKVFDLAASANSPDLREQAAVLAGRAKDGAGATAAARYLVLTAASPAEEAASLLAAAGPAACAGVLDALRIRPILAEQVIGAGWLTAAAGSEDPAKRQLAATAAGIRGGAVAAPVLHQLLADADPGVVAAACRAAGETHDRAYVSALLSMLTESGLRGSAIDALTGYGVAIVGTLGDVLEDRQAPPAQRRQIPRVLRKVSDQKAVDVLLRSLSEPDISIRLAVLKALNRLRESAPQLDYGERYVVPQILHEARTYCELHAALAPLSAEKGRGSATALLVRSLGERSRQAIDRLFRLLGLRYPPKDIHNAYLAVTRPGHEEAAAAIEFLDSVLDGPLKRVVVPVLEPAGQLTERGRELFGIDIRTPQAALAEILRSRDPWLTACAAASAGECGFSELLPDLRRTAQECSAEVRAVAAAAEAALA